jgi:hypothetical protein
MNREDEYRHADHVGIVGVAPDFTLEADNLAKLVDGGEIPDLKI